GSKRGNPGSCLTAGLARRHGPRRDWAHRNRQPGSRPWRSDGRRSSVQRGSGRRSSGRGRRRSENRQLKRSRSGVRRRSELRAAGSKVTTRARAIRPARVALTLAPHTMRLILRAILQEQSMRTLRVLVIATALMSIAGVARAQEPNFGRAIVLSGNDLVIGQPVNWYGP